jgi:PAS domain S-box-containing protein
MTSSSRLIDTFRFGKLSQAETATVWPILVVATLGFIAIGTVLVLVARSTIERQTDHWIETSLRASATTGKLMVEGQFIQAHQIAALVASRLLLRDFLTHHAQGLPNGVGAGFSPKIDMEFALRSIPQLLGISLLDAQGVVQQTVGTIPALAHDAFQGQPQEVVPLTINGTPVLRAMAVLQDAQGAVVGADIIYCRLDALATSYQNDLGSGPGLISRMCGQVDGRITWLLPSLAEITPQDAEVITPLLAAQGAPERILHDRHQAISGIRMRVPQAPLVIALDLDAQFLEQYHSRETGFLTMVLMSLTLIGASGMTLLLKPLALRMVRQRQQLDRTILELRRSEEFNRRITANIPDRIEILDREGRVVSMTEGGTLAGEVSEITARRGARWLSFWSAADRELAVQALEAARGKSLGRFRGSCDRGSGVAQWWDVAVAPILDAEGRVEELLVVSRDITADRAAQARIMESEKRYQLVASATNDVIWDWTIASGEVWWSEAITSQFGYAPAEIQATIAWWTQRIHADDRSRVQDGLSSVITSHQSSWRAEYRFRKADGSYIHVLNRAHVLRDDAGAAIRMIGALFDLTDRRRAIDLERRRNVHAALRADVSAALVLVHSQQAMLQTCAEAMIRHGEVRLTRIWILEDASQTLVVEASAGPSTPGDGALGRIPLGSGMIGLIAQERRPRVSHDLSQDLGEADQPWIRQEGLLSFAGCPLLAGEVLIGVIGMFSRHPIRDDTVDSLSANADLIAQGVRRTSLERQLSLQAAALQRTNTELEQFTYVTSHDLQEPLRTIANYLSLLDRRYREQFDERSRRHIDHSISAAKRLQALIRDLLAYSRAGHRDTEALEEVPGDEAYATALSNLESAITDAKAVVSRDPLPVVPYNRTHLVQLLQNLIGNAIKYRGEAPPVVQVSAVREATHWTWSVQDNGIGVDPAYHARIFEVFQRLHGRDIYQGTGIGLALCKKIVDSHGGRIWVESQLGQGARFCFTIPLEPGPNP